MTNMHLPILYSYRRCPYAMRARLALKLANITVEIREISLREKPAHLLQVSAKGTVPVLVLPDGRVIDESLQIMFWAFNQLSNTAREKNAALQPNIHAASGASLESKLIETNDTSFKKYLDCYKYPERYVEKSALEYRQMGEVFLQECENLLQQNTFLFGQSASVADYAIFPFVRQFAAVDSTWFAQSNYPKLRDWLNAWVNSDLFASIMTKNPAFAG